MTPDPPATTLGSAPAAALRDADPAYASAATPVVAVRALGKCYEIYARPLDRLKQTLWRGRRSFYREFWALRDVSFEVGRGESFGIIGRNGSGKSTVLQVIAGTLRPTEGQVEVHGRVHALLELGSGFNFEFTGRENVYLNGALLGLAREAIAARFDEVAAFADIGEFIDQPVKTYSTGMVVRLAFAVQALLEPDVLIVDEALAVGDAAFQRKCFRRLDQLRARGVAILFVSHSLELVRSLCSRALYLQRGRTQCVGPASEVCDAYLSDLLQEHTSTPATPDPAGAGSTAATGNEDGPVLDRYVHAPNTATSVQDSGVLRVVTADIRPDDPAHAVLFEGDTVRIHATVRAYADVTGFLFGVLLRDRYGTDVFGFSTRGAQLGLGPLRAGEEVRIEASVKCDLRPDTYFVTIGLQEEGFAAVLYYAHDILKFALELREPARYQMIGGLARLAHAVSARPIRPQEP